MKLEQQVTSLELSKKLKELGVKQESLFYWCEWSEEKLKYSRDLGNDYLISDGLKDKGVASAFTVAELGEMLPRVIKKKVDDNSSFKNIEKFFLSHDENTGEGHASSYTFYYYGEAFDGFSKADKTEANARAKMLVYLIENKLHDPIQEN